MIADLFNSSAVVPHGNGNGDAHPKAAKMGWEEVSRSKQAARDALIPKAWRIPPTDALNVMDVPRTCGVLSAKDLEMTELNAVQLVEQMVAGKLTSYEVTLAFCKRAAVAQQLVLFECR